MFYRFRNSIWELVYKDEVTSITNEPCMHGLVRLHVDGEDRYYKVAEIESIEKDFGDTTNIKFFTGEALRTNVSFTEMLYLLSERL